MNRRFRKEIKSVCGWNVSKIYYTIDEATGNILIDLYEIEKEAISVMQKRISEKESLFELHYMKTDEALKIIGGSLSKPSKMPGWSIGLPAKECKTGSKLAKVPGSVCYDCYALKGCYVFKVVQDAQYRRLAAIKDPRWVDAMAHLINSKKPDVFRWHDSGDVQDLDHLMKIFEVCELTPSKRHWLPTREAWIKKHLQHKPNNLVIRFSAPMVNQRAHASWPNSSSVITEDKPWFGATSIVCPSSKQGNQCLDCRQCWNPDIKNISYIAH